MYSEVIVKFGKSHSSYYDKAIEYASSFDHFIPIGEDSDLNAINTDNNEIINKMAIFNKLIDTIGSWKSAEVYFRDKKVRPRSFQYEIQSISDCAKRYAKSTKQDKYCDENKSENWGCKFLNGIVLDIDNTPYYDYYKFWYKYGDFINEKIWKVDKEKIAESLLGIIENKHIDFCPVFQLDFFQKYITSLPDEIDISDETKWGIVNKQIFIDNVVQQSPVSIFHKNKYTQREESLNQYYNSDSLKIQFSAYGTSISIKQRHIPNVSYNDVGGIDEILQTIREVIELPITKPDIYKHMGLKPYKGILLWGDPGNGKTLIAKAIAHEVKAHFIAVNGPEILSKWFGESEQNMRMIFLEAKDYQPSIIFFDEIDSIASARNSADSNQLKNQIVNQLLTLMDGIEDYDNVTILASTNRPDLLDYALLRPGRFDYKIEIKKPNLKGRAKILEIASKNMPLGDDVNLLEIASMLQNASGAEVTFIAKEAAMIAMRRSMDLKSINSETTSDDFIHIKIHQFDFIKALDVLKNNK